MGKSNFVWFEYVGGDSQRAQGFFGELFNWKTQAMPMGDGNTYSMIALGDRAIDGTPSGSHGLIGGYSPMPVPHPHWLSYLEVADARASEAKVKELGGKVIKSAFQVADVGVMAIVTDPHGGTFALWQPLAPEGAPSPKTAGTFTWNELYSNDPAASVAFYRAVAELSAPLTVDAMEMPGMGTYHVLKQGDTPVAGIMKAQPGQPHAWLPYVLVDGADATTARAKQLGANVLVPPTDIPNVGRFAIVVDPQGAALGVLQAAR